MSGALDKAFDGVEPPAELRDAWLARHRELGDATSTEDLDDSVDRIIDALGSHRRQVYLALALALAARTTFELHGAGDEADHGLEAVRGWLATGEAPPAATFARYVEGASADLDLDEARSLYFELGRALDPESVVGALRTMLDDALTGQAVTSYSDDRRQLYNWVIAVAAPAALAEREPARLATRAGVVENA